MPAINFKQQFVDKIKSGEKTCTIRPERKNRIVAGQELYLYSGIRTKDYEIIKNVICKKITYISIYTDGLNINNDTFTQRPDFGFVSHSKKDFKLLNKFARLDGFKSWDELINFFEKQYGLPFHGVFINFGKPKKLNNDIIL